MITQDPKMRIPAQQCPICGEIQDVIINGYSSTEKNNATIDKDRGYSFCNCRNIFFTDWKNIQQEVYSRTYVDKYEGDFIGGLLKRYWSFYEPYWNDLSGEFLEMGTVNDANLEEANSRGFKECGLDIFKRPSKHRMIFGNFEDVDVSKYKDTFSLVFSSHIFEHFKEPIAALKKVHGMMKPGGRIMLAMPDPYFIDWTQPYAWGHWHLGEHHVMWDMDSLANEMEKAGFRIIVKRHNIDALFICIADMHIIAEKI